MVDTQQAPLSCVWIRGNLEEKMALEVSWNKPKINTNTFTAGKTAEADNPPPLT